MRLPQILMIGLLSAELGMCLADAVHEKKPSVFVYKVISVAIWIGLLTWGGFWK